MFFPVCPFQSARARVAQLLLLIAWAFVAAIASVAQPAPSAPPSNPNITGYRISGIHLSPMRPAVALSIGETAVSDFEFQLEVGTTTASDPSIRIVADRLEAVIDGTASRSASFTVSRQRLVGPSTMSVEGSFNT